MEDMNWQKKKQTPNLLETDKYAEFVPHLKQKSLSIHLYVRAHFWVWDRVEYALQTWCRIAFLLSHTDIFQL